MNESELWERERLLEALDSYERGLSDAPHLRKWSQGPALAALAPAGREVVPPSRNGGRSRESEMTFVVSNEEVDRHGDVVRVEGWDLRHYTRNPVFLWAHDYTRPAIGRAVEVWKDAGGLMAAMEFGPTEFAQEVASLYRGGYQRGVSVGFKPLQYETRRDGRTGEALGIIFARQELLEISAAPVPANQSALKKALDGTPRMQSYYSGRGFSDSQEAEGNPLEEILDILRSARR